MYLTQEQIDILTQNLRRKSLRIELLDINNKVIDRIEGQAIGGSINANAENDIRRSGSINMAIPISESATTLLDQLNGYSIEVGGKVWLDKKVKISVGIENVFSFGHEIVWYKLGVFLINKPVRTMSATDYTISFECIDEMARLTGKRQGQLTGQTTLIEQGYYDDENVYHRTRLYDVLVSTITELAGITQYTIANIPTQYEYLPYDIKLGVGATVYDILKQLLDILSTWQMYFDLDGVFIVEPIPSGENAIVYDLDNQQYITDQTNVNFENVKNQIVIYGRLNTLTYYTENTEEETNNVEYDGDTLILRYSALNPANFTIGGTTFGFYSLNTVNTSNISKVKIFNAGEQLLECDLVQFENSTSSFGVDYGNNNVQAKSILPKEIYFLRIYSGTQTKNEDDIEVLDLTQPIVFEFRGKQSVSYNMVNDNKESPFYINSNIEGENYYAGLATTPDDLNFGEGYALTLNNDEPLTSLQNNTIITFQANATNLHATGSNNTLLDIYTSEGVLVASRVPVVKNSWVYDSNANPYRPPLEQNKLTNDYTIWELKYETNNNSPQFVLLGRNPSAITSVLSGGEYDNIYADQLAYERCLYELFLASNTNDSINLSVVPNYLIDVNCKIAYYPNDAVPKNIYDTQPYTTANDDGYSQFVTSFNKDFYVKYKELQYYITKQISYPLGVDSTAQSISAVRIYSDGLNLIGQ